MMRTHHRAVYEVHRPVELTFQVSLALKFSPDLLPNALSNPATEAAGDGRPFAEPLWDVTPGSTRSQHPQDPTDDRAVVQIWTSQAEQGGQEGQGDVPTVYH